MERKVLVTGATGYVGTSIVPLIAKRWPVRAYCRMDFGNAIANTRNVEFMKADMRDTAALAEALEGITDVIHLAGIVTSELAKMNPNLTRDINVRAMDHLCRLAALSGVSRFIYASSSGVYGTVLEDATEETMPNPEDIYMQTKLDGEKILEAYAGDYTVCSVRMASLCGPAPRMRLDTIVNLFSMQAYFKGLITVWGGNQWRTNLHGQEAAGFYQLLLNVSPLLIHREVFNITSGNHIATALASLVADIIPSEVVIDRDKVDERHYRMSAEKAKSILGWKPKRTVEDAIRDNVAWFAAGKVKDPDDVIYYNTRRMESMMKGI